MTSETPTLASAMAQLPLVAILRGLRPDEAVEIGQVLVESNWSMIEVPLNSPQPLKSIAQLVQAFPDVLVGAGTVLSAAAVREVHATGAQLIVAPNFNPEVVREAVKLGMLCLPGVATPTEAFAALDTGAAALKLFPAEMISTTAVRALRSVLPRDTLLLPVGGITAFNMAAYRANGANGFGIGSALYRPGMTPAQVADNAREFATRFAGSMNA